MSSLMQHRGRVERQGVELFVYLRHWAPQEPCACDYCGHPSPYGWDCANCGRGFWGRWDINHELTRRQFTAEENELSVTGKKSFDASAIFPTRYKMDSEPIALDGRTVARLYRIWRKPVGMFGQWVLFRVNGKKTAPDLSCPIDLEKLPRDAKPLTDDEMRKVWFS